MDHVENTRRLLVRLRSEYAQIYESLSGLDSPLRERAISKEDMVDIGFFCREMAELADDLRKECKARQELAGKLIALQALEDMEPTTRGQYATGSSEGGVKPTLPRSDSPEHAQLCDLFNVPEEHRGIVRFHWKTVKELLETYASEGKDFPVNIPTTPDFKTVYRRKR